VTARVLLAARDPGAAGQLAPLAAALAAEPRVALTIAAGGAARERLDAVAGHGVAFALAGGAAHVGPGEDTAPLLAATRALLDDVDPDVIVTGVSSLGVGIDEALHAVAGGRPTFAVQDYPGDANAIEGAYAGHYFVRDEAAARLTRARFGVGATPIGSLRHAAYAGLDVAALRRRTRAELGAEGRAVVGFFAQPAEIPGHEAAFDHLARAVAERATPPLVLLRPHPKSPAARDRYARALALAGAPSVDAADGDVEPWLAACDVVATGFSHCTMDHAFLSAFSPEPLGTTLFLLTTPDIRTFLRDTTGLAVPDGVEAGLGRVAERSEDVRPLLDALLADDARRAYHAAARRLPHHADLPAVIARVLDAAGARRAAR